MFFWCKVSIHMRIYLICISKYLACLSLDFSESLLSDEILKQGVILFQKCFFTHFWKIFELCGNPSIWWLFLLYPYLPAFTLRSETVFSILLFWNFFYLDKGFLAGNICHTTSILNEVMRYCIHGTDLSFFDFQSDSPNNTSWICS